MEIFDLLKRDHERVSYLFQELETRHHSLKDKEQLFDRVKQELDVHAQLEEGIFYPELKSAEQTRHVVQDALREHSEVKGMLYELSHLPKSFDQWMVKLSDLKEKVEHHVKEEEDRLFPNARMVLGHERAEELAKIMKNQRQEILAHYERFREVS